MLRTTKDTKVHKGLGSVFGVVLVCFVVDVWKPRRARKESNEHEDSIALVTLWSSLSPFPSTPLSPFRERGGRGCLLSHHFLSANDVDTALLHGAADAASLQVEDSGSGFVVGGRVEILYVGSLSVFVLET